MRARAVERSSTSVVRVWVGSLTAAYYDLRRGRAYLRRSRDSFVPAPPPRVRKVDAREQQQQVAGTQEHRRRLVDVRPRERPALKPLVEHPETAVIPHENLEAIATPIAEEEQMTRQRIEIEALAHQRRQSVDRASQIGRTGRDVDPDRRRDRQHDDRSARITARTRSGDVPS